MYHICGRAALLMMDQQLGARSAGQRNAPLDLALTPPFDPADPEPLPVIDFDQSGF